MTQRVTFDNKLLPYGLLAPQIAVTLVFFFWPAVQAVYQSFLLHDPFGLRQCVVWFENFRGVLTDPRLPRGGRPDGALQRVGDGPVDVGGAALRRDGRSPNPRRHHLQDAPDLALRAWRRRWPAVLWLFMFHPSIGLLGQALRRMGVAWDYKLNGRQAMLLVILAASWTQVSYNIPFFLAGLLSIQKAVIEAAASTGPAPSGASGASCSRCCRRSRSSSWW